MAGRKEPWNQRPRRHCVLHDSWHLFVSVVKSVLFAHWTNELDKHLDILESDNMLQDRCIRLRYSRERELIRDYPWKYSTTVKRGMPRFCHITISCWCWMFLEYGKKALFGRNWKVHSAFNRSNIAVTILIVLRKMSETCKYLVVGSSEAAEKRLFLAELFRFSFPKTLRHAIGLDSVWSCIREDGLLRNGCISLQLLRKRSDRLHYPPSRCMHNACGQRAKPVTLTLWVC